jgi:hypothetical protein
MNLNAETYNLLMNVMGAYFQAMGRVRATLTEQPPAPPALMDNSWRICRKPRLVHGASR